MSKKAKLPSPLLKRRTRQHVIADLAANHVERFILQCGHTAERIRHDYGIDMFVSTYDRRGFVEPGYLLVQLKAAERLRRIAGDRQIAVRLETAHLAAWLEQPMPMILTAYDAESSTAYWLYVQRELRQRALATTWQRAKYTTMHIPVSQRFDQSGVEELAAAKRVIVKRIRATVDHHA